MVEKLELPILNKSIFFLAFLLNSFSVISLLFAKVFGSFENLQFQCDLPHFSKPISYNDFHLYKFVFDSELNNNGNQCLDDSLFNKSNFNSLPSIIVSFVT